MKENGESFLRLYQVLEIIPISRSGWWKGCKEGKYPKPIKLGPRTTVWRASEIQELVARLSAGQNLDDNNGK